MDDEKIIISNTIRRLRFFANEMTQQELAARLGTVREVVARSLRELERCGALRVNQRQILILNRELLLEWAQTPIN